MKLGDSEPEGAEAQENQGRSESPNLIQKELKRKRTREGGAGEQAGADRRAESKILHPDDMVWICGLNWSTE